TYRNTHTFQGGEHAGNAFAVCLVTGGTGAVVNLFAARIEVVEAEGFGSQFTNGRGFGFLVFNPGAVVFLAHRFNHNGHEAVIFSTELCALAAIDAGFLNSGPGLFDKAGDGILLNTE